MESVGQDIKTSDNVSDIVKRDYRAADVFRKYGIDYCCGGKWPLGVICESGDLDAGSIIEALRLAQYEMHFSHLINYEDWDVDFLIDFIEHVHHPYFVVALPDITALTEGFLSKHASKYPGLTGLSQNLTDLSGTILHGIHRKQEILFPYIKQITHAHTGKEPYARLLARTLKKPLEELMRTETQQVNELLLQFRVKTGSYTPPENACISHRVTFAKLRELDISLQHYRHLEYDILFPRALAMERDLAVRE